MDRELENRDKEMQFEQGKLEKDRQFELDELHIQNSVEISSMFLNTTKSELPRIQKINIEDLVPKFNPKLFDITLLFKIFKRSQRKRIFHRVSL